MRGKTSIQRILILGVGAAGASCGAALAFVKNQPFIIAAPTMGLNFMLLGGSYVCKLKLWSRRRSHCFRAVIREGLQGTVPAYPPAQDGVAGAAAGVLWALLVGVCICICICLRV